ncbi:MAG TPA: DoxX family protein [Gemmatimonadales bacterium]|nr:DoxX family protein [Gemmatimonadales bacterium]
MNVLFPALLRFSDVGLLLLRLMVAAVFFASGLSHLQHPAERSKSIGATPAFTVFLGSAEVLGSVGVALGIVIQLAAAGLILIMLGAIQKKIFVWKTGFWGDRGYGWHYDLMLAVMNLVILLTGGGKLVLLG